MDLVRFASRFAVDQGARADDEVDAEVARPQDDARHVESDDADRRHVRPTLPKRLVAPYRLAHRDVIGGGGGHRGVRSEDDGQRARFARRDFVDVEEQELGE